MRRNSVSGASANYTPTFKPSTQPHRVGGRWRIAARNADGRIEHPGNRPTQLNDFVQMARQNRSLSLILAHWGGGLPFFELNPRLRPILRNVLYDTAAGPLLYDPRIFRTAVDLVGPSKILFGSDYPLRLFPREQKIPDLSRYVEGIRDAAGLDDGELWAIFRDNARRLLGS